MDRLYSCEHEPITIELDAMSNIIPASFRGITIRFDLDGWMNATDIAKAFGTRASEWMRRPDTVEYMVKRGKMLGLNCVTLTQLNIINELEPSSSASKSRLLKLARISGMVKTVTGSNGGTWLHPKMAVKFARWLSVDFEIWCDIQVEQILESGLSIRSQLDDALSALEIQTQRASCAGRELALHRHKKPVLVRRIDTLISKVQHKLPLGASL